ncbi:hypothetical protein DERF_008021 [Dermatophagoides farinae]|uniref:Uncharacterized protein n=1 Tax=Dermatophagoides farinae TaxID=6954 RepID=A0A922I2I8_DERFA|nr:hypothetical protein DERF_008015 [Dermatophagoides farinae]KAH9517343.1 hypothetical protein DERF_008021 [Dermatophagoides farinae]
MIDKNQQTKQTKMSICLLYMVIGHHRWIAYRIHYKIYEMDTKEIITYSFSGHNVSFYEKGSHKEIDSNRKS